MIGTKLNSFRSPVSSQAMTLNSVNVDETAEVKTKLDNNQIVSEIVQASNSAQTDDQEDQEVDDAEIDSK